MLLYIMLFMNAYLMLFTVLFNAVCLYNAYFLPLTFSNAFGFHAMCLGYRRIVSLFQILFCIMYSAFN